MTTTTGPLPSTTMDEDGYPMDKGRSWLVMLAGMLACATVTGFLTGFGIFIEHLSADLKVGWGLASLAGGICTGFMAMAGIPGAAVYTMIGPRMAGHLGAATAVQGLISAAYAPSMNCFLVSSATIGTGFGFIIISLNSAQTQYFLRFRRLVLALLTSGAAMGTLSVPRLLFVLVHSFRWRGALLVYAGLASTFHFYASVARSRRPKRYSLSVWDLFKPRLFASLNFCLAVVSGICWGGSAYIVFLMVKRLASLRGMDEDGAADILLCIGVVNLIGRLCSSFLMQMESVKKLLFHSLTASVWCVGILLLALLRPHWAIFTAAGIFGGGFGLFYASAFPCILELVGAEDFPQAVGMYMAFGVGIGSLSMSYAAGALADAEGVLTVLYVLLVNGILCTLLSAILVYRLWPSPAPTPNLNPSQLSLQPPIQPSEPSPATPPDPLTAASHKAMT